MPAITSTPIPLQPAPLPAPALVIERVDRIGSTNAELLRRPDLGGAAALWLVAREQTHGRGRRGRSWLSDADGSLTASLAMEWSPGRDTPPGALSALPLAVGLAIVRTLSAPDAPWRIPLGRVLRLKWPNDVLLVDDRPAGDGAIAGKAGGVLCEARTMGGRTRIVAGVGLNLWVPVRDGGVAQAGAIRPRDAGRDDGTDAGGMPAPIAPLPRVALFDAPVDRIALERALGDGIATAMRLCLDEGFESMRADWLACSAVQGREVDIHRASGDRRARVTGVEDTGALRVQWVDGFPGPRDEVLMADEISLRFALPEDPAQRKQMRHDPAWRDPV